MVNSREEFVTEKAATVSERGRHDKRAGVSSIVVMIVYITLVLLKTQAVD